MCHLALSIQEDIQAVDDVNDDDVHEDVDDNDDDDAFDCLTVTFPTKIE